jgi:hypothetical protein
MTDEQAVETATRKFYQAIEAVVSGQGTGLMKEVWHHTDKVTSKHPSGEWSIGWDEVSATWEIFASFGREDRGGSSVSGVAAHVYGDLAYTTSIFQASPAWGAEKILCTNSLQRLAGEWKIIHHHADSSPGMQKALERILAE